MPRFRRILFPVDLSEASPGVVPIVRMMAERFNAGIHLLFVARVLHHYAAMYVPDPSISRFEREVLDGAEKRLYEFKEAHFPEVADIKTAVLPGEVAEEILRYAGEEKIDLIIMGTHGRKGLDKIVFGSVADRVVKTSRVPVMVINPYSDRA